MPADSPKLHFKKVDHASWPDFERLFEGRGGPKYCWCMVWRDRPSGIRGNANADKKAAIRTIVESDTPIGIVGYIDEEPVAWCSVAPRPTYREGLGGTERDADGADNVWSIACFFIPRRLRGSGLGDQLLAVPSSMQSRMGRR